MAEQPFFSIVMPVYGVENYIAGAIESLLAQTYQDYELILVDDCTKDKSGMICDAFASKYDQIQVLHLPENGGLSNARNKGFEKVKGSYVWFMDSDDTVDPDLLERVYDSLQKNPAKVVVWGLVEEYVDASGTVQYTKEIMPEAHTFVTQEELRPYVIELEKQTLYGYAWNKCYEVDYLRRLGLPYEKITLIEDILFNVKYCMDIDSMNLLPIMPYHYMKRMDGSLTNKFVADYFKLHRQRVKLLYDQYQYWGLCDERIKQILAGIYVRYILSALERNCHAEAGFTNGKRKAWLGRLYQDSLFQELMPHFVPESTVTRIAGKQLAGKHTSVSLAIGRSIYIAKNKLPMFFAKIKQNR